MAYKYFYRTFKSIYNCTYCNSELYIEVYYLNNIRIEKNI